MFVENRRRSFEEADERGYAYLVRLVADASWSADVKQDLAELERKSLDDDPAVRDAAGTAHSQHVASYQQEAGAWFSRLSEDDDRPRQSARTSRARSSSPSLMHFWISVK